MRRLGVVMAVAVLSASGAARAQSADDKAAAEVLFEQGKAALKEGRLEEACPKLAESLRLDVGTGTMLYLAECYERSGKTASAWAQFREAQSSASRDHDAREKIARERAEALEPKLAYVIVTVAPEARVDGLAIARNGAPIGATLWGVETPIDPGKHIVRATAPNHEPWQGTLDVPAGVAHLTLVVPRLRALVQKPSDAPAPPPRTTGSTQRTVSYGLIGLSLVGIGVGTFFGIRAIGTLDEADRHCDASGCDKVGLELAADSKSEANISTIVFVASGAALAGALVLWITAPSTKASVALAPLLTPSLGGLAASTRF